jgi:hypothetical protein
MKSVHYYASMMFEAYSEPIKDDVALESTTHHVTEYMVRHALQSKMFGSTPIKVLITNELAFGAASDWTIFNSLVFQLSIIEGPNQSSNPEVASNPMGMLVLSSDECEVYIHYRRLSPNWSMITCIEPESLCQPT